MTEVQSGWECKVLMDLAEYYNGAAFKPKDWAEDGLPIVRIEQINRPDSDTDKFDGFVDPSNLIDSGDLIFSWSATLKVIIWKGGPAVLNQHLYKVVPNEKTEKGYLLQLLDHNMEKLAAQSQGSTMKHVTRRELTKFRVCLPKDPDHQNKIATILATVDEAIERTEALIGKYEQVKAGMMQDLFTRGITSDGKLRLPRNEAPDLYQDTTIGWIPKDWELLSLESVSNVIDPNPSHRNPVYHEAGFPFISTVEFKKADKIEIDTPRRVIEEIVEEQERRCCFNENSIAFSRKGTIGKIRFLPSGIRFALLDSLCVINASTLSPLFLFHSLRSDHVKRQIKNKTMGQALPQMSIGRVREIQIPVPNDPDEQDAIALRINSLAQTIFAEFDNLQKLRQQKSGLMHDLLTGTVPVKV